jgi:signal transduction histidine kinase/pSer/pThr/pTyr-binding forkhead associated (FHA) protein
MSTDAINSAKLIPKSHVKELEPFYLVGRETTIGRHPSNSIVIPLDSISRFHSKIIQRGSYFIVKDLNSSNGCFVNGDRVEEMMLHHRDRVTFGEIEFEFRSDSASSTRGESSFADTSSADAVEFHDDSQSLQKPRTQHVIAQQDMHALKDKSSFTLEAVSSQKDQKKLVRLTERLRVMYALSELLRVSEHRALDKLVDEVLDLVFSAVPADRGVILTRFSPGTKNLEITSVRYKDAPITPQKVSISSTILNQVTKEKVAILSSNVATDNRFDASDSIIASAISSVICVPMIQMDDVVGVFYLETRDSNRNFTHEDLEFVSMIANELGLTLENRRMRVEAAHKERLAAVGETVAGISHNAKNILLLMKGGSQLVDKGLDKDNIKTVKESWAIVKRGIDKISTLVQDMLEYSSNKKPMLQPVEINELVMEIAEDIENRLVAAGVTLELDLEENLGSYMIDKTGIQRTLDNMIVNSLEAFKGDQKGHITITTSRRTSDGALRLTIRDNGSGIPKHIQEKIFMPFFTTKGSTGTGLGLPMCKKVVEDNGGTLELESTEGVGTLFTITIPRQPNLQETSDDSPLTIEE